MVKMSSVAILARQVPTKISVTSTITLVNGVMNLGQIASNNMM